MPEPDIHPLDLGTEMPRKSSRTGSNDVFNETYVTPKQIAEHLMVTEQTVRSWLTEGLLVGRKFGAVWRITKRDFVQFVDLSVKRGQRYEPSDELKERVSKEGYKILDSYGGGEEVTVVLDIDPVDEKKDELYLTSKSRYAQTTNEKGHYVADHTVAPRYCGTLCIIDSDVNPYGDIMVDADSHSEVLIQLIEKVAQLDRMFKK